MTRPWGQCHKVIVDNHLRYWHPSAAAPKMSPSSLKVTTLADAVHRLDKESKFRSRCRNFRNSKAFLNAYQKLNRWARAAKLISESWGRDNTCHMWTTTVIISMQRAGKGKKSSITLSLQLVSRIDNLWRKLIKLLLRTIINRLITQLHRINFSANIAKDHLWLNAVKRNFCTNRMILKLKSRLRSPLS